MSAKEKREVVVVDTVFFGNLIRKWVAEGTQRFRGPTGRQHVLFFEKLYLNALERAPLDEGSALKRLYLRSIELQAAYSDFVTNGGLEDSLPDDFYPWLSDEQLKEWRHALEEQGILTKAQSN